MNTMKLIAVSISLLMVTGCLPSDITVTKINGEKLSIKFYPGGNTLDDLIIIEGKNYFGKSEFQISDPKGDIGFKFKTGERVQAECVTVGKNIIGDPECKAYTIYRSNFSLLPIGSKVTR